MAKYIDGFVIPLKVDKVEAYRQAADRAGKVWVEHGALEYYEAVGDDLNAEDTLSFKKIAGATDDETVIFALIIYSSREHRDAVNAAVMEDPRIMNEMETTAHIFDFKRMAYGGFKAIVEYTAGQDA